MENQEEQMVLLKHSTFNLLANYIAEQPYKNVAHIFPLLQEAKLVEENKDKETPTLTPVTDEKEEVVEP